MADIGQQIADGVLDALRAQKDDKQELDFSGSFIINPQAYNIYPENVKNELAKTDRAFHDQKISNLGKETKHTTYGPITFQTRFSTPPDVTFGQVAMAINHASAQPAVGMAATSYVPFLVQPYVFKWTFINGEVDGFYVGLYALTAPPAGIKAHTVSWRAKGKGTRYKNQGQTEAWNSTYNYNNADHLVDNVGEEN